ncbi:DUF3800 domain-containing protein [Corynebacterium freneyi]|uniref:DUF3800 domain-containing protein n=1 Tax=Corynebacterium freneyi TaxID=134034 RepID=UPI001EF38F3A|nr:DUF3800 domain-containing protein [Corynebacterium freneyi]MCG7438667.1 DUF3800 domain-containing protein [Corynebacterium freneyi]
MLHAFVDESESDADYFFLSALIVKEDELEPLNRALDDLMVQYSTSTPIPAAAELHGHDMMQQKCDWKGLPVRLCAAVYLKAMTIIDEHATALYVECIDRVAQSECYARPFNHRTISIGFILERINEFAEKHDETVTVYLDDHYTAEEGRKEFVNYKANGTFGFRSSKLARIDSLDFYDSRAHRGLQAADLCTYIANRILTQKAAAPKVVKLQNQLWGRVSTIRDRGRYRVWPTRTKPRYQG